LFVRYSNRSSGNPKSMFNVCIFVISNVCCLTYIFASPIPIQRIKSGNWQWERKRKWNCQRSNLCAYHIGVELRTELPPGHCRWPQHNRQLFGQAKDSQSSLPGVRQALRQWGIPSETPGMPRRDLPTNKQPANVAL